jgi:hypothetical protein
MQLDEAVLGRSLRHALPDGLFTLYLEHIALAARYHIPTTLHFWWERDGVRVDRVARFRVRRDGDIDIEVTHLGTRPAEGTP